MAGGPFVLPTPTPWNAEGKKRERSDSFPSVLGKPLGRVDHGDTVGNAAKTDLDRARRSMLDVITHGTLVSLYGVGTYLSVAPCSWHCFTAILGLPKGKQADRCRLKGTRKPLSSIS